MKAPVLSSSSSPLAGALSTRAWLALGAALVVIAAYRWGVPLAAWIAPVPFLIATRRATRWRARLVVLAVLTIATTIQVGKIMTAPLPLALALPFALPAALTGWLVLVATEATDRKSVV